MKHLFDIHLLVIGKNDTVTFPEGTRHYIPINTEEDLYEPFADYAHLINFKKQKAFVLFVPKESLRKEYLILNLLKENYGITKSDLLSKGQKHSIVFYRYLFFYLLKKYSSSRLIGIGKILKKDHTTVMHGIKNIENIIYVGKGWEIEVINFMINKLDYESKKVHITKQVVGGIRREKH